MKKLLTYVLVSSMLLSMAACGQAEKAEPAAKDTSAKDTSATDSSATATPEAAAEPVTLKIGTNQAEDHPWNIGIETLVEKAAEYSDGLLIIENYPNGTMGSEPEMMESVNNGTLDMVVCSPELGMQFCPTLEMFSLPFLFRDHDHWVNALDGQPGTDFAARVEDESNLKILGYWGGAQRNILSVKAPIKSIDDLQGFKMRLAPSDLRFKIWEAIGTLPVSIAYGETYSALQAGVCDGMENEMPSVLSAKFYEAAPYFAMTGHEFTVRPLFINEEAFDELPAELQEALTKAAADATQVARDEEAQMSVDAQKIMEEDFGIMINDIDKAPIMEKTAPLFAEFGEKTGTTDIINAIVDMK